MSQRWFCSLARTIYLMFFIWVVIKPNFSSDRLCVRCNTHRRQNCHLAIRDSFRSIRLCCSLVQYNATCAHISLMQASAWYVHVWYRQHCKADRWRINYEWRVILWWWMLWAWLLLLCVNHTQSGLYPCMQSCSKLYWTKTRPSPSLH